MLDRRFGLARGFDLYDDRMPAEQIGEYGYPERDARQVTDAALGWISKKAAGRPYFLWVHYYDPHAPYRPPPDFQARSEEGLYSGEIAYMDREIGRLLARLPGDPGRRIVAAVGDHGESRGEHGERAHGLFLYRAVLEVPMIVAGTGVPEGRVVSGVVATRNLASTLLRLAGDEVGARRLGLPLPGLAGNKSNSGSEAVYSETWMPAGAFGWSPLRSFTEPRLKLVAAPRPELYDVVADPGETQNLIGEQGGRREAARLKRLLDSYERRMSQHKAAVPAPDAALSASLRGLGYLSGAHASNFDPKDGLPLLQEFASAQELLDAGKPTEAAASLSRLVQKNPRNIPFLTQLARAQFQSGDRETAAATYRRAVAVNPALDFLHLNLADACREMGQEDEARKEYETALKLNPSMAAAWLRLAGMAEKREGAAAGRRLLRNAVESGAESASVLTRLAELELAAGEIEAARRDAREALRIAPAWAPARRLIERLGPPR